VIEVEEFPALAREYQMTGVPKTIINDKVGFVGDLPDEAFLNAILETLGLPPTDMAEPPVEVT
jgi:predicted DsbA family dithiol-disulfide isomerase